MQLHTSSQTVTRAEDGFVDWLKQIEASGWNAGNMYEPAKVMESIRLAIFRGQRWDDLPYRANCLFKSINHKFGCWALRTEQRHLIRMTPECVASRLESSRN
jgi:hypothetical protein